VTAIDIDCDEGSNIGADYAIALNVPCPRPSADRAGAFLSCTIGLWVFKLARIEWKISEYLAFKSSFVLIVEDFKEHPVVICYESAWKSKIFPASLQSARSSSLSSQ
jgi:hypothetical protein